MMNVNKKNKHPEHYFKFARMHLLEIAINNSPVIFENYAQKYKQMQYSLDPANSFE